MGNYLIAEYLELNNKIYIFPELIETIDSVYLSLFPYINERL